jgi:hypothetical protein
MPLATKNNAIIVKDGKLAEDCDCCGGWYCCPSVWACDDIAAKLKFTATLTAYDVNRVEYLTDATCFSGSSSLISASSVSITPGGSYAGTFSLSSPTLNANDNTARYTQLFTDGSGCTGAYLTIAVGKTGLTAYLVYNLYQWQAQKAGGGPPPSANKTISDMQCSGSSLGSTAYCGSNEYYASSQGIASLISVSFEYCTPIGQTFTGQSTLNVRSMAFLSGDVNSISRGTKTEVLTGNDNVSLALVASYS